MIRTHIPHYTNTVFTKSNWAPSEGVLSSSGDVFTSSHTPPTLDNSRIEFISKEAKNYKNTN